MESQTAAELIGATEGMRTRTRLARRGAWFPMVAFGVLTIGAAIFQAFAERNLQAGHAVIDGNPSLYWIIGMFVGYAASVVYYRRLERRTGVETAGVAYLVAGFGLMCALSATFAIPAVWMLSIRGNAPLIAIALGLVFLAWFERSPAVGLFSLLFLAIAALANLYNMENILARMGFVVLGDWVNAAIAGSFLLAGGLGFAIATRRARAR